jgi:Na+/H+-dicarboxylate symporter
MTKLALHYQILIAMVLGAAIGVLVNPGDVQLGDAEVTIAKVGGKIAVQTIVGESEKLEVFASEAALAAQYPEFARLTESRDHDDGPLTIKVTGRHVHLTEDGRSVEVMYTRNLDGKKFVSKSSAPDAAEFVSQFPQWKSLYKEQGGGFVSQVTIWSRYIGDLFLRLLKMITVPLIVTSLVTGVAGLGKTSRLGTMFGRTMLYYLTTSLLAIVTGILIVNLVQPGVGADIPGTSGKSAIADQQQSLPSVLADQVQKMIPENPIYAIANGDFLSIIVFSILLGIFIIRTGGESGERLRGFFEAGFDVMMQMTLFIISLAPIGVFAFMLFATASQGLDIFRILAWYMLAVFLALLIHATITLPLIVKFVARRSPLEYARAMSPALMTAFSTASSNGTLPLTMTCVEERAGVSNRVSSFVLPLGATINMDGTALYEVVAVLFIAQGYATVHPEFQLTLGMQVVVALTALLASVGAAGIPHAGLVMMLIVLDAVGLPTEAQGVIIAVDRVLDMCRTSVNVWSDSCGCAVMDRFETADPPDE